MSTKRFLTKKEIETIISNVTDSQFFRNQYETQLKTVYLNPRIIPKLICELKKKHDQSLVQPGTNVGIIAAQSIGERFTQSTLNIFHQAGLLISGATKGIPRVEELLNASKNPKRIFYRLKSGVIETHKSQFHSMLSLDSQARSSHVWDIYNVLGIEAVRDYLSQELVAETTDIHVNHLSILVDKMTFTGEIRPVNRRSMKKDNIGVFAKASFEESFTHFINAAIDEETDNTDGLSASIVCGKKYKF